MTKVKRINLIVLITIMIALISAATILFVPHSEKEAEAQSWQAWVTRYNTGTYAPLGSDETLSDTNDVYFFIADTGANNTFYYYVSNRELDATGLEAVRAWSTVTNEDVLSEIPDWIIAEQGSSTVAYKIKETLPENSAVYIYFRRTYTSAGVGHVEFYERHWHVTVNTELSSLGIHQIDATYLKNNVKTDYAGEWIGVGLTFTVTTDYMYERSLPYSAGMERLYYSVDQIDPDGAEQLNKVWYPMSTNVVTITTPLKEAHVDFKVTDVGASRLATARYAGTVSIDINEPTFSVSATTKAVDDAIIPYDSSSWSCNEISFEISRDKGCKCISDIEYFVSVNNGVSYEKMETMVYVVRSSTRGIRFRARNGAGVIYTYQTDFNANIDKVQPGVNVSGTTINPDNDTSYIPVNSETITERVVTEEDGREVITYVDRVIRYANGQAIISVYNRDTNGADINNESGARFFYHMETMRRGSRYVEEGEMTNAVVENGITHYNLIQTIDNNLVYETRDYQFYIVSNAGLTSQIETYTVTLLNSTFEISVEEIDYVANSSGWSAEPITVKVTAPSDSKIVRNENGVITGYTTPTIKYNFFYSPTNVTGELYEAEGTYFTYVEGEEGKSVYTFTLNASAESTFNVYAVNQAGKRSKNTYTSAKVIKIDTQLPTAELTAYIKPNTESYDVNDLTYIKSGDWVNGRIMLTLRVKNGVSGVYVKDMKYAIDGMGQPVYNSNGELVWQEVSGNRAIDGRELSGDGNVYYIYNIEIGLPNSTVKTMSEEYRYRVYTGSGVYKELAFVANIDTNEILLESVRYSFGDGEGKSGDISVASNTITLPSMCENGTVTLIPNAPQIGHFDYYIYRSATESYEKVVGNILNVTIPNGYSGTVTEKLYLVSRAIDFDGGKYATDVAYPYIINIPYNTLNVSIKREIFTENAVTGSRWVNDSEVTVAVTVSADNSGAMVADKENYSYFYMLVNNGDDLSDAIASGAWIAAGGSYNEAEYGGRYVFTMDFTGKSFYGHILLSVTNEAGYRSSGEIDQPIQIDCTTPNIEDMIVTTSGSVERSVGSFTTVTYYSKDDIIITPKDFPGRSPITYFYKELSDKLEDAGGGVVPGITENPSKTPEGDWTHIGEGEWQILTGNITLTATGSYTSRYYVFYAINEVGNPAGGLTDGKTGVQYEFILDATRMEGSLSYSTEDGGYFDSALNMYAYIWEEQATITLSIKDSSTYVKYSYSLDDGKTWEDYLDAEARALYYETGEIDVHYYAPGVGKEQALRFNATYFREGIKGAFKFKATNKAGMEYIYPEKIYIAIDTVTPRFELVTTVEGLPYDGGELSLSEKSAANWSSKPVTIAINMLNNNTSGVKITYTIQYLVNNVLVPPTEEREVPSYTSFTTDRLDGFGYNRDALITIYATSRANKSNRSSQSIRVKVDQVTPVFTLTGHASNDDSTEAKIITSGQWTNYRQVAVTKAADEGHVNVSGVTYKYIYSDRDSTGTVENNWPDSGNPAFDKICSITVIATTDAGLSYEQVFDVNIDTIPPIIKFLSNITVIEYEKHYIDLKVYVEEENIEICEYITTRGETRGFALDPTGYVISTSSVDNTIKYDATNNNEEYRGYVKVYVKDYAGNEATFEFYMLPFALNVNNVTLSDGDRRTVDKYEEDLEEAKGYIDPARETYFRNLISRLRDRISTLENEIQTYRAYLERLAQRTTFELKSDYAEMYEYMETYNNYEVYGQKWMQSAITGDQSSKYYAYFRKLEVFFETLQAKMKDVETVETKTKQLPAINVVDVDDYDDVLHVFNMYDNLSSDQKACFTTNLYTKLLALKKKCEILLLSDEDTGISLDAEFSSSAKVSVETFSSQSEYYTNAQTAILNTVGEKEARAIVSIYNISLKGAASQTSTGEVTVNMPIPEEYRQYIRFAVYKMGVDGTITKIDNMEIEGDGKSVTFTTDELATFVLAVKANIEESENKSDTFGTLLGLDLDITMIRNIAIVGASLFGLVIVVVIIAALRNRRFLNTYNRAYKSGIYRKGIQRIPKGNTTPRENPVHRGERVKTQKKPYRS